MCYIMTIVGWKLAVSLELSPSYHPKWNSLLSKSLEQGFIAYLLMDTYHELDTVSMNTNNALQASLGQMVFVGVIYITTLLM